MCLAIRILAVYCWRVVFFREYDNFKHRSTSLCRNECSGVSILSDLDLYSTECSILNPLTESEYQIFLVFSDFSFSELSTAIACLRNRKSNSTCCSPIKDNLSDAQSNAILDPLTAFTSPGGSQIYLEDTAMHFDTTADALEGLPRLASLLSTGSRIWRFGEVNSIMCLKMGLMSMGGVWLGGGRDQMTADWLHLLAA
jgi:hypothetical protein